VAGRKRDLALFNLAIDSKLRGCDVVALHVNDVAPSGYAMDRATIRQKKTGRPVRFELTDQTRLAIDEYLRLTGRKPGQFLFPGRGDGPHGLTTKQYARLVHEWVASIGLDPAKFGTHSLRRISDALVGLADVIGDGFRLADHGQAEDRFCIRTPIPAAGLTRTSDFRKWITIGSVC
jgi:integrase